MMLLVSCLLLLVVTANFGLTIFVRLRRQPSEVMVVRGISLVGTGRAKADELAANVQRAYRSARRPAPPVIFLNDEVEMTVVGPEGPPHRVVNRR